MDFLQFIAGTWLLGLYYAHRPITKSRVGAVFQIIFYFILSGLAFSAIINPMYRLMFITVGALPVMIEVVLILSSKAMETFKFLSKRELDGDF